MKTLKVNRLSPPGFGLIKSKFAIVALSSLALGCALPARAEWDGGPDDRPPVVPAALQVPAGNELAFHFTGVGVQIYGWSGSNWVFKAPEALLLNEEGDVVGHHYAGPTWEANDGSKVVGSKVAGVTVDTNAIPWLLLKAVSNSGPGIFSDVSYIQRLNTVGGLAPSTPGTTVGQEARVPYMAEYVFYRRGGTIYRTGFEAPVFVAGSPLVGQDGWVGSPPLSPNAAIISTDQPRIGRQTVRVLGGDLVHQDFINTLTGGYYDAIGSYRHPVNYDTGGKVAVRVSAHVRVDGPQTATGNNFFAAAVGGRALLTDGNGTAGVGELDLSSDGHVYGSSGDNNVPVFQSSTPVTLGQWHELAVVSDFATQTYSFFVDDQYLGTFPFPTQGCGACFTTTLLRGSMLATVAPDTTTLHKADYSAHYDNFSIEAIESDTGDSQQQE